MAAAVAADSVRSSVVNRSVDVPNIAQRRRSSAPERTGANGRPEFASRRPRVRAPHAPLSQKSPICRDFLHTVALLGNVGASAVRAASVDSATRGVE